ncbi:hypothetical protein F66182_2418 [Fusarium sp. NRRL 66182]|nr:hypothetical protein F66182_2418 [Fusarium sp. NRRL 66182]
MKLRSQSTLLVLVTRFFFSSSAAPNHDLPLLSRRDDPVNAPGFSDNNTVLEPVVPPAVDPRSFSIFTLDPHVVLAWAGSSDSGSKSRRMRKRDDGIFSQANFTFKYPVVPLDHSKFIPSVSCSKGKLTGTISSTAAYSYAKSQWKGARKILFITSVDGCGDDNANDLFLSHSVTFSDDSKTFTAKGSQTDYADVYEHLILNWGGLGTLNVRRAIDKRAMFEPHALDKRLSGSATANLQWSQCLHDSNFLKEDEDAPWEHAALLVKWGKEEGEADDSWQKGEVADPNGHHKRWDNSTLSERDLTYGVALYCVECGFSGSASLTGTIDFGFGINRAEAQFNANFKAGLNLGLAAFIKYEKEWDLAAFNFPIGGFGIPGVASIEPFIEIGLTAGLSIEASGTLLVGAGVEWENIDILIDMKNSDNSHSEGLTPKFTHTAEAKGELKAEASLGLPISLGLQARVLGGLWKARAGVKDTPSIVLQGSFEVSADITEDGEILSDVGGDCYGIAWNIHFENTLDAFVDASGIGEKSFQLIEPMESDPIAQGCIGYVNDGTGDDGDSGFDDDIGMSGNGLNSGGTGLYGFRPGAQPVPQIDTPSALKPASKGSTKSTNQKASTQTKDKGNKPVAPKKQMASSPSSKGTSTAKKDSKDKQIKASAISTTTKSKKPANTSNRKLAIATNDVKVANNKQVKPAAVITTSAKPTTMGTKATSIPKSSSTCLPSAVANNKIPSGLNCKKVGTRVTAPSKAVVGKANKVVDVATCASNCLKNSNCISFSYNGSICLLYSKDTKSVGIVSEKGRPTSIFYDRQCFEYSKCSK